MCEIVIDNSVCKIKNIPINIDKLLRDELKYTNQSVSFAYFKNLKEIERLRNMTKDTRLVIDSQSLNCEIKRLEYVNKGLFEKLYTHLYNDATFPTGLLPRVLKLLTYSELQFVICDNRKRPSLGKIKYILRESFPPLRYYQKTAARLAAEKGRGVFVAPTGSGKTVTLARMIWDMGLKVLVITPGKAITDNMSDTLIKHFGKGQVTKLNTKSVKTKNINICNIQALVKLDPTVLSDIDCVFIDEFHHMSAESYQRVNLNHLKNCYFRIGLTATNFRNDGSDMGLEAVLSEVLYEYPLSQAFTDGFLVRPSFQIITNDNVYKDSYQTEYKQGIVENHSRNKLIADIVQKHKSDSVLILVQQIEHGEALKKLIPGSEFINGDEKDSVRENLMDDFRKGKLKHLIGTTVLGEGVDLPIAKVLVMAGGGKARSAVIQNIGRILRPFLDKFCAIVYDFVDKGSKHLSKHSEERREIYKMYEG